MNVKIIEKKKKEISEQGPSHQRLLSAPTLASLRKVSSQRKSTQWASLADKRDLRDEWRGIAEETSLQSAGRKSRKTTDWFTFTRPSTNHVDVFFFLSRMKQPNVLVGPDYAEKTQDRLLHRKYSYLSHLERMLWKCLIQAVNCKHLPAVLFRCNNIHITVLEEPFWLRRWEQLWSRFGKLTLLVKQILHRSC